MRENQKCRYAFVSLRALWNLPQDVFHQIQESTCQLYSININICGVINLCCTPGYSKKTWKTLVVNIFRTTNDKTIPPGLYDTATHKVLCTPSIHFNVSFVCHVQDIKSVHKFLPCSAQHVCVQLTGAPSS